MGFRLKIFQGILPSATRSYLRYFVSQVKPKKVIMPCCGQFTIVKAVIDGGVAPENIYCSDISLFSSILGYVFTDRDIKEIPFVADDPKLFAEGNTNMRNAAILLYDMQLAQLPHKNYYQQYVRNEFLEQKEQMLSDLERRLQEMHQDFHGIHYEIADMREQLDPDYGKDTLVVINPPTYRGGYENMFEFPGITYKCDFPMFDFDVEFIPLVEHEVNKKHLFMTFRFMDVGVDNKHLLFGLYKTSSKKLYAWWVNRDFATLPVSRGIVGEEKEPTLGKTSFISMDYEITENTKLAVREIHRDRALLLRDLLCHKMGATDAESFYEVFLDNYSFGVFGMHAQAFHMGKSDYLFEMFGFNVPLHKYSRNNRLLMLALTSSAFQNQFYGKKGFTPIGIDTVCFSKYRKMKLNNGILVVTHREKQKNGDYKIKYRADFRDETYPEVVKHFLDEEIVYEKDRTERRDNTPK